MGEEVLLMADDQPTADQQAERDQLEQTQVQEKRDLEDRQTQERRAEEDQQREERKRSCREANLADRQVRSDA